MRLFTLMTIQIGALKLSPGTYLAEVRVPLNSIIRGMSCGNDVAYLVIETTEDVSKTEIKKFFIVLYENNAAWIHNVDTSMLNDETANVKFLKSGSILRDDSCIQSAPLRTEFMGNEVVLHLPTNYTAHTHNIHTFEYLLYEVVHLNPTVSGELDL